MKNMCIISALSLMLGLLALCGVASAHGTEKHDKTVQADIQMKKLHAMMPMFSMASAELESALEKGDATAAKTQANRILAAVPDLKKSRPHKNAKQIGVFKAIAGKIRDDANKIIALTEIGSFAEAQRAFRDLETHCAECHSKFRD